MMAEGTTNPSETSGLTKKQAKALERVSIVSSEPWLKPSLSEFQAKESEEQFSTCPPWSSSSAAKPGLKSVQSLSECTQLLQKLSEEVNNLSQGKHSSKKAAPAGGSREPDSLERSRSLILTWAAELDENMMKKKTKATDEKTKRKETRGQTEKTDVDKQAERLQRWAVELWDAKEANGVSDGELKKLLYPRGSSIKSRVATILPLLEFVTWSLLAEDTEESVSMMWLTTKQKAWRTAKGNPKYIPNSVSIRFDVSSCHPSLLVSSDRLQVCEAATPISAPLHSQTCSDWPCVLGDAVITTGRHYWEVEISPNSSWRTGVMSPSALKKKKRPSVSPRGGFWTLWKASSFWACTDEPINLQMASVPGRLGVYVDMGEGQVSFFDVDRRVHIYTFSDTFKHGLIPVFGWLDEKTLLKIRPAVLSVPAQGNQT
ncbi:E3 ubiquitin-protein ligase TRIM39-like isoform X1 [Xyrichtys novacula]|uniref:E3 ubiquitin-protein ligase TRIM39-like isoform X1 n=1 Tax=Xyrichtys novacula TaxID=13765 RepID=A0AAV1HKL1_XYRNO|nr:E3 ubiquitin-protein ligase TRIM39-like isoform X1 [Xyrichtys novacula]